MSTNIPNPVDVAKNATYATGPDAGQINKVAPGNSYGAQGVVPGIPFTAGNENFVRAASNAAVEDAQLAAYAQAVAIKVDSNLNFYVHIERTNTLVSAESTAPTVYVPDGRLVASLTTDSSLVDHLTLTAYRNGNAGAGSPSAVAYMLSDIAANQSKLFAWEDSPSHSESNTAATAAPTTQWVDMCADDGPTGIVATTPVLIDAGGHLYAVLAGTWTSIATLTSSYKWLVGDQAGTWIFGETVTAFCNGIGAGGSIATHAATWDGAALPSPQVMTCRPAYDSSNARWIVATANPTSENTFATTGKVWTSTDGFTWTTLATTAGTALTSIAPVRGWLFALGKVGQLSGNPWTGHGGIEVFISRDGGATWIATGHVVDPSISLNVTNLIRRTRIRKAGAYVIAQSILGGFVRALIVLRAGS